MRHNGFRDRPIRPLSHSSGRDPSRSDLVRRLAEGIRWDPIRAKNEVRSIPAVARPHRAAGRGPWGPASSTGVGLIAPASRGPVRFSAKNEVRRAPHSSARTPARDRQLVVEPGVVAEVVEGAAGTGPRVGGPEDEPADPGGHQRAGAHGAGLEGHHQGHLGEPPAAHGRRRRGAPGSRRGRWDRRSPRARCGGPPRPSRRPGRPRRPAPRRRRRRAGPRPGRAPWRPRRSAVACRRWACPSMRCAGASETVVGRFESAVSACAGGVQALLERAQRRLQLRGIGLELLEERTKANGGQPVDGFEERTSCRTCAWATCAVDGRKPARSYRRGRCRTAAAS